MGSSIRRIRRFLDGYVDSDWASSAIDRKSTSGCCFSMGLGVISWFSRKKSCVALSATEVEYVVTCSASCEVVWLRKLLSGLFDLQSDVTCIYCDNQSCVKFSENPMFHDKFEAYRDQISLYQGYGVERSSEAPVCCDGRADS